MQEAIFFVIFAVGNQFFKFEKTRVHIICGIVGIHADDSAISSASSSRNGAVYDC